MIYVYCGKGYEERINEAFREYLKSAEGISYPPDMANITKQRIIDNTYENNITNQANHWFAERERARKNPDNFYKGQFISPVLIVNPRYLIYTIVDKEIARFKEVKFFDMAYNRLMEIEAALK